MLFPSNHPLQIIVALAIACLATSCLFADEPPAAADQPDVLFSRDIAPLLVQHCVACHNLKTAEGNYRVDTFAELSQAGDSGLEPLRADSGDEAVDETDPQPGHVAELLRRLITDDESERMPEGAEALAAEQIELIRRWLAAGAVYDRDDPASSLSSIVPPPTYPPAPENYPRRLPVTAVAFTPDGGQVVASGYHELSIWDIEERTLVRRIGNLPERIFSIAFSPDGATLAVAGGHPGRSGEVRLVDFASGEVRAVLGRTTDSIHDVAFRPDGSQLAIGGADSLVQIIDLQTLDTVRTLAGHADWVTTLAWTPDGTRLVSGSRDKSAKVFDIASGELLSTYSSHGAAVRGVLVSSDGTHGFSVGDDKRLHRWQVDNGSRVALVPVGGNGFHLHGDASTLIVPASNRRLVQIDLGKNSVEKAFEGLEDWAMSADWHRESGQLVAGSYAGDITVWNIADAVVVSRWVAKP